MIRMSQFPGFLHRSHISPVQWSHRRKKKDAEDSDPVGQLLEGSTGMPGVNPKK